MQLAICDDDEDSHPPGVGVTSCRASLMWGLGYAQAKAGNMDLTVVSQPCVRQHKAERQKWIPPTFHADAFSRSAPRCQTDDRQLRLPDGSERGPPSRACYRIALQDEIETA